MTKQKFRQTPFGNIRKLTGLTQEEFAARLGITRVHALKIEQKPYEKLSWCERSIVALIGDSERKAKQWLKLMEGLH